MRLIILAGFAKTDANGNPDPTSKLIVRSAVSGSAEAQALSDEFAASKHDQKKPEKGIRWLSIGPFEPVEVAVFISPETIE